MTPRPLACLAPATLAAALLVPGGAFACGACIEDKVAATYDHATVTRALGRGKVVVFAEVRGAGPAAARTAAARDAARRVRGIERSSVRISEEPSGLSFVLDTKEQGPKEALAAVQRAARLPGLELAMLQVLR